LRDTEPIVNEYSSTIDHKFPAVVVKEPAKVTPYTGESLTFLDLRKWLVKFARSVPSFSKPAADLALKELKASTIQDICPAETNIICAIAFLPKSQLENQHLLETLKILGRKYQNDRFIFTLADEHKQHKFKKALLEGASESSPRLIVWNAKKNRVITYDGDLEVEALSTFLDVLVGGGRRWTRLSSSPTSLVD